MHENAPDNIVWEMATFLSRGRWLNGQSFGKPNPKAILLHDQQCKD